MRANPMRSLTDDWLPEFDFGLMSHGFVPHGRDYQFVLEARGTYELMLTHVVDLHVETRVMDDVWPMSWDDVFTDYAAWEAAGHPQGYVWGSYGSLAYPGLIAPDDDPAAQRWSERLGKPMFAMSIETDRFKIAAIFHGARARKLSEDNPYIRAVIRPLGLPQP